MSSLSARESAERVLRERDAFAAELRAVRSRALDLIALLRQAEWFGPTDGGGPSTCPWCRKPAHADDCPVVPVLYPKERA